jgi:hypothetical protein
LAGKLECVPGQTSDSRRSPRSPFLANFRIANHPGISLEVDLPP